MGTYADAPVDRRAFIRAMALTAAGGVAAAAGTTSGGLSLAGSLFGPPNVAAANVDFDALSALVGDKVRILAGTAVVASLRIVEISPIGAYSVDSITGEAFSLFLEGASGLSQDTYWVEHTRYGTFPLFLAPVGLAESVQRYEAVFNRIV